MIEISAVCCILSLLIAGVFVRRQRNQPESFRPERFTARLAEGRITPCRLRPYADADFEACMEIHDLIVKAGQVPPGYEEWFAQYLRQREALILVCEVEGNIRGLGGILIREDEGATYATCSYGLIHPAHQRNGYGTALLLARLGSLPPNEQGWVVHISSQGASPAFYERFGFRRLDSHTDELNNTFGNYVTILASQDRETCLELLQRADVGLETNAQVVPVFKVKRDKAAA